MGLKLNQFLGHSSTTNTRAKYLSKWKKNEPPKVDIWLHTQCDIESLWQHGVPRLFEKEDKASGEKEVQVWSGSWTCWEEEEVLQKQFHRDRDTGERSYPPCICPMCRLIEYIRDSVEMGELDWVAPMFKWVGSDPSKAQIIHAGGMYNAYGAKDLTDEQKNELKEARIWRKESWKENMVAKLSYVFAVVDNAQPQNGVQIAIETSLLGDKTKECINAAMISDGEEEGNPLSNPYAIRWIHRPNETEFQKKYGAVKMGKFPLTQEVRRLIYETEAPDLERVVRRKDPNILLAQLQEAYIGKFEIPWADIFSDAIEVWKEMEEEAKAAKETKSTDFDPDKLDKPAPKVAKQTKAKPVRGRGNKSKAEGKATPPKPRGPASTQPNKVLCYECGEFMVPGKPCAECGFDPGPQGAASPEAQDSEDDMPY